VFADDIELVKSVVAKHGPLIDGPIVECGGLIRPTIANYQKTIDAMNAVAMQHGFDMAAPAIRAAQMARYENIERPLSFLGDYIIENPETGGTPLELLERKYRGDNKIGTAILLSVLEHVEDPFWAINQLGFAMKPGGLVIVSVPFIFPHHPGSGEDNFRFTSTGLRKVFGQRNYGRPETEYPDGENKWEVLESAWRLDISASAGVLDIHTGQPQAIKSCYIAARYIG